LILISGVYLLRALALVPVLVLRPDLVDTFAVVSSLVVLAYGLAYAIGTWTGWPALKIVRADAQKLKAA
jgi:phosphate/sulfate permease